MSLQKDLAFIHGILHACKDSCILARAKITYWETDTGSECSSWRWRCDDRELVSMPRVIVTTFETYATMKYPRGPHIRVPAAPGEYRSFSSLSAKNSNILGLVLYST